MSSSVDSTIRPISVATSIGRPTSTGTRESIGEPDAWGDRAAVDVAAGDEPPPAGDAAPVHDIDVAAKRVTTPTLFTDDPEGFIATSSLLVTTKIRRECHDGSRSGRRGLRSRPERPRPSDSR